MDNKNCILANSFVDILYIVYTLVLMTVDIFQIPVLNRCFAHTTLFCCFLSVDCSLLLSICLYPHSFRHTPELCGVSV